MKKNLAKYLAALCTFTLMVATAGAAPKLEIVEVKKIWDAAPHNAFTDIVRFDDQFFVTFREGERHVHGVDGKIRVIASKDGETWESQALLAEESIDLRDPKLSITPDGRLMLLCGGSDYEGGKLVARQPRVMFSKDGKEWTEPAKVLADGDWLWRATWHGDVAHGVAYGVSRVPTPATNDGDATIATLYKSSDGLKWEKVVDFGSDGRPNETTVRFLPDDTMLAWVRRENADQGGWIGSSKPPYTDWKWSKTSVRLGGPNFIVLPSGTMIGASRDYTKGTKTMLGELTATDYKPTLALPSSGDTSYAGLLWHDDLLWVSYYSSHEGKTSIYLAKVKVTE